VKVGSRARAKYLKNFLQFVRLRFVTDRAELLEEDKIKDKSKKIKDKSKKIKDKRQKTKGKR